ncbi:MAG: hypothetical protein Q4A78_13230 [Peptostreptococcaceae bacterium]|nr:hypothetical protein [Peptostreptococcaceae bacterium]
MMTEVVWGQWSGTRLTMEFPKHSMEKLKQFQPGDLCTVEIRRPKDKRSLEQNRLIWRIIGLIDRKINGYFSDEMNLYCSLIRQAKIKTHYFETLEAAKGHLEEVYRVVEEVERRVSEKGTKTVLYRCYIGTSKFTKEEMSDFIEVLINRAYQEGIDVHHYEDTLRGGEK